MTRFKFRIPNDISGTADARIVKFYTQVDYIISQLTDDKPPLKGAWPGSPDTFSVSTPTKTVARVGKFCKHIKYIK